MTTEIRIGHGSECYVSTATPTAQTVAAYNLASTFAHASNGGRYRRANHVLSATMSTGEQRNVATIDPMDATIVTKQVVDITNPGVLTLEFLKKDDDTGQAMLLTAHGAKTPIVVKMMLEAESGGAAHQAADEAAYFRGLVTGYNPYNAGAGGDYINVSVTIELIVSPLSNTT